jgi:4Fe-4S ferredoxin
MLRMAQPSAHTRGTDNLEPCNDEAGRLKPVVDRNRCEGKEDCVRVCPYDVFEIRTLAKPDRASLSLVGRIKAWAHGGKQAYVVLPDACHACRLCVDACPENALTLAPVKSES